MNIQNNFKTKSAFYITFALSLISWKFKEDLQLDIKRAGENEGSHNFILLYIYELKKCIFNIIHVY